MRRLFIATSMEPIVIGNAGNIDSIKPHNLPPDRLPFRNSTYGADLRGIAE
ncbi:MAG: hypothetical protein HC800_11785 [Phormidesmis sp. RL_2_1]|nr:hypothetical protein [Phormidesmis sp. RL_2_1]